MITLFFLGGYNYEETKQVNKMSDVYKNCPAFENDRFLLRFSQLNDASDLVSVYSDKNALPFFNSDNCHGDYFYYPNEERMREAIEFWLRSYSSKWFVRWTIIDKEAHKAIGSIEVFHRSANDDFNHVGVLRLDLKVNMKLRKKFLQL